MSYCRRSEAAEELDQRRRRPFSEAATFDENLRFKFSTASTNLLCGKMLAERNAPGDADKARDLLTKAHAVAAANGYGNVERRATQALANLE